MGGAYGRLVYPASGLPAEVVTEMHGHLYLGPPKTTAGRRRVGLPRVVVEALQQHLAGRPIVQETATAPGNQGVLSEVLPLALQPPRGCQVTFQAAPAVSGRTVTSPRTAVSVDREPETGVRLNGREARWVDGSSASRS